jgi:hypothetical protein
MNTVITAQDILPLLPKAEGKIWLYTPFDTFILYDLASFEAMLETSGCKFTQDGCCHVALAFGVVPGSNITRFDLCDLCPGMQNHVRHNIM